MGAGVARLAAAALLVLVATAHAPVGRPRLAVGKPDAVLVLGALVRLHAPARARDRLARLVGAALGVGRALLERHALATHAGLIRGGTRRRVRTGARTRTPTGTTTRPTRTTRTTRVGLAVLPPAEPLSGRLEVTDLVVLTGAGPTRERALLGQRLVGVALGLRPVAEAPVEQNHVLERLGQRHELIHAELRKVVLARRGAPEGDGRHSLTDLTVLHLVALPAGDDVLPEPVELGGTRGLGGLRVGDRLHVPRARRRIEVRSAALGHARTATGGRDRPTARTSGRTATRHLALGSNGVALGRAVHRRGRRALRVGHAWRSDIGHGRRGRQRDERGDENLGKGLVVSHVIAPSSRLTCFAGFWKCE